MAATPDGLEAFVADVLLIEAAVLAEVDACIWSSTGGSDGCAQCSPVEGERLSFKARVERGHLECARELAADAGARGVKDALICGGLRAEIMRVLRDPRLLQWIDAEVQP